MQTISDIIRGDSILKSKRKQLIMEELLKENFVTLEVLVSLLETSESTVRRDLDELESERKLHRVHGGAEIYHSMKEELTNQQKSIKNIHAKKVIAQKALEMIASRDVIFIDAGTTNELLIDLLYQEDVTVVTNSIHHATKLVEKNIRTIIIGGAVKNTTDASIGYQALEQIGQLNFDKAFIGMNGIDNNYLTTPDLEEAAVKKAIIENAQKTYALIDNSKIGHVSFAKVHEVSAVDVITNHCEGTIMEEIKEKTKVITV